ncbi:MAG: sialate O-acetylesterase [Niabella sp.]
MKFFRLSPLFVTIFFLLSPQLHAKIRLPYFFSDGMVLQRESTPAIWGWTDSKKNVTITTSWNKKIYTVKPDANGKWKTFIQTTNAGGPYAITVNDGTPFVIKNVLLGEVWMCSGQSNMEMPMKGYKDQPIESSNDYIFNSDNNNIRLYTIPRSVQSVALDTSKNSTWKTAAPQDVSNFSATAYFFGLQLYNKLKVPIGLINVSYGGSPVEAFMDIKTLEKYNAKIPEANTKEKLSNKIPTVLYNGMIHPFIGYGIKGAIWYQGETNAGQPAQYESLFPDFVSMLRKQFGYGEFPFYYVQIAPWDYNMYKKPGDARMNSAFLRDAQRKSLDKIPNSGMVVTMDIGDSIYIHPRNKKTVGKRLAYLALNNTYGFTGFQSQSPLYESVTFKNDTAIIRFTNAPNGLTSYGQPLVQFEIAGSDKVFYPANARTVNGTVEVSSPSVKNPVAVRYAFKDWVKGDLYNSEGFPASSFRTDDW